MTIFIIAALTVDGFIARSKAHSSVSWRSKADRDFFIKTTRRAGVVVMGATTFQTMRRPMPERLHFVYSYDTSKIQTIPDVVEVTQKEPTELLKEIQARGYKKVAICGGSSIYTMFMEAGVVDKLYLTIEPVVFGAGIRLFNKELDAKLRIVSVDTLGENTLLLEYDVIK